MKPKWLIEDFDADNSFDRLAEEVKRQGMTCEIIRYIPFEQGSYNKYPDDDCVIVVSSLNLARQLLREKKWIPNAWLTAANYECSTYYAHFGEYLFNSKYAMLPRTEVKRRFDELMTLYGVDGEYLFMRPSSGLKTFTGKVFHKTHFDSDWSWVEEFTEPESLIVVSTPKDIKAEWRFVVAEGEIISGSLYRKDGSSKYKNEWPEEVDKFARKVAASEFQPDPMWSIDICKGSDDKLYLLEIGCFSCAGLYSCDLKPIVETAASIAIKEWKDLKGE